MLPSQNFKSIGLLAKEIGENKIVNLIDAYILEYLSFINPVRRMTATQIHDTSIIIFEEFKALKAPEIGLIFRKAKLGEFKSIYEGIDGAKILSWFSEYFNERMEIAENLSYTEHQMRKKENCDKLTDEQLKKLYRNAIDGISDKKAESNSEIEEEKAYQMWKFNYENKIK